MFDYTKVINSHTNKPYSIEIADYLTRAYGYMVRHNFNLSTEKMGGEPSPIHDPEMTHLRHSIGMALRSITIFTPSENFIDKVLVEIDNIKLLYENKPTYEIYIQYPIDLEQIEFTQYVIKITTYYEPNTPEFNDKIILRRYEKILEIKKV